MMTFVVNLIVRSQMHNILDEMCFENWNWSRQKVCCVLLYFGLAHVLAVLSTLLMCLGCLFGEEYCEDCILWVASCISLVLDMFSVCPSPS